MKFEDIFKFISSNPKKAIVFIISFLVFAFGSLFFTGCAYKFHVDKADNMTHSIDIRG